MARTVNYENRAAKIKEQIDELVKDLTSKKPQRPHSMIYLKRESQS